jgi:hypothetical protein
VGSLKEGENIDASLLFKNSIKNNVKIKILDSDNN